MIDSRNSRPVSQRQRHYGHRAMHHIPRLMISELKLGPFDPLPLMPPPPPLPLRTTNLISSSEFTLFEILPMDDVVCLSPCDLPHLA